MIYCRFILSVKYLGFVRFIMEVIDMPVYTTCLYEHGYSFLYSFDPGLNAFTKFLSQEADRLVKAYFEFKDLVPQDAFLRAIYFDDFKDWDDDLKARFIALTGSLERSTVVFNCISELDRVISLMPALSNVKDPMWLFKGTRALFFLALLDEDIGLDNDKTSLLFKNKNFIYKVILCCYGRRFFNIEVYLGDFDLLLHFGGIRILNKELRFLNGDWFSRIINHQD